MRTRLSSFLALLALILVALPGAIRPAAAIAPAGPPATVLVEARDRGAVLRWTPPPDDGGSPVIGYRIMSSPGSLQATTSNVMTYQVAGLTNGTAYTFTLETLTAAGWGPASSATSPVTPAAPHPPRPPTSVTAFGSFQSASIRWTQPADTGGVPLSGYVVTSSPGDVSVTVGGDAVSADLTGLSNGTAYTFAVQAKNAVGASPAVRSGPVVPGVTVPGAVERAQVSSSADGLQVQWLPPLSDGGAQVTGYTLTIGPGGRVQTVSASTRSAVVRQLTVGTEYTVAVVARNAAGEGPALSARPTVPGAKATSRTKVLSAQALAALTAVHPDNSLEFTNAPDSVTRLVPGDVVVATAGALTPRGLLRTVASVTTNDATTTVATTSAALSDALSAGDLSVSTTIDRGQVAQFRPSGPGITLQDRAGVGASAGLSVSIDKTLYDDGKGSAVTVKGNVSLTADLAFEARVGILPPSTSSSFTATVNSSASVSFDAKLGRKIDREIALGTVTLSTIPITVGPIIIFVTPVLDLTLTASGDVTVGASAAYSRTSKHGAGITTYNGTVSTQKINESTQVATPPNLYASMNAKVGPKVAVTLLIDDVIGPYVTVTAALHLSADTSADDWWKLTLDTSVGAGFKIKVLSKELADYKKDPLFTDTRLLLHADGPFMGVTLTPKPAVTGIDSTLQLQAAVRWSPSQYVKWSVPAGGGTVSAAGLYAAPHVPGTYRVSAMSPANGLKPATLGVLDIQVGAEPPDPPTGLQAWSLSSGTAAVSWSGPLRNGGSPVTGYEIRTIPATSTTFVAAPNNVATVTGLPPSSSFRFTVSARNAIGLSAASFPTDPTEISDKRRGPGGTVRAWGYNNHQELGNVINDSNLPVKGTALSDVVSVAGGDYVSYALRGDGTVWAWGYNSLGELGNGTTTSERVPIPGRVRNLVGIVQIAGGNERGYALRADGTVWAWGYGGRGATGNGSATRDSNVPIRVTGLNSVTSLAGGRNAGYALRADGTVWAWGSNGSGALGAGLNVSSSASPVPVSGLTGVTGLAGGEDTAYAVKGDGTVWSWGDGSWGALGDGAAPHDSNVPVRVTGLQQATSIAAGDFAAYARLADGTARSWGQNKHGQLGDGTTSDSNIPVPVDALSGVTGLAGGRHSALAMTADGTVHAWGDNYYGTLGTGNNIDSPVPKQVVHLAAVTAISGRLYTDYAVTQAP